MAKATFDPTSGEVRDRIRLLIGDTIVDDNAIKAFGTEAFLTDEHIDALIEERGANFNLSVVVSQCFRAMSASGEACLKMYDRIAGTMTVQQIQAMWDAKAAAWLSK